MPPKSYNEFYNRRFSLRISIALFVVIEGFRLKLFFHNNFKNKLTDVRRKPLTKKETPGRIPKFYV